MSTAVSSLQETVNKYFQKTIYLENQRRNNLRFERVSEDPNEKWDDTEEKIKNVLVEKLDLDSAPEIDRAHRTGRPEREDGTSKQRTVVCKFTSYKVKESILRKARRIKPEGIGIFEDLAEETVAKRRSQLRATEASQAARKDWIWIFFGFIAFYGAEFTVVQRERAQEDFKVRYEGAPALLELPFLYYRY